MTKRAEKKGEWIFVKDVCIGDLIYFRRPPPEKYKIIHIGTSIGADGGVIDCPQLAKVYDFGEWDWGRVKSISQVWKREGVEFVTLTFQDAKELRELDNGAHARLDFRCVLLTPIFA